MTLDTADTTTHFLKQILDDVHPLMAEGLHLAAVPHWYNRALFSAMRQREDGRDEGIVSRLTRYSFVAPLQDGEASEPVYTIRPDERDFLQRHWIAQDPQAYRTAHQRALAYWEAYPDPNPFAQAQNRLYHLFFVDRQAAADTLIGLFRTYYSERHLAAIERLLATANEARVYLVLLNSESLTQLDDLLAHLQARLAQLRGRWTDTLEPLRQLRHKADLAPGLRPYVARAYGAALAQLGHYVEAMEQYTFALKHFNQPADTSMTSTNVQAEVAYTMIALGEAHVDLAVAARGYRPGRTTGHEGVMLNTGWWQVVRSFFYFFLSLPLVVYLSVYLGRRVWHPRFWATLRHLDWIIARLFAVGAHYYAQADPLLEAYGLPAEGVTADEKLAYLYLAMGDAQRAQEIFSHLLAGEEAALSHYRQATVRLGLGQAWLRLGQPELAREQLELAWPVLQLYEDSELQAQAQAFLAEANLALRQPAEGVAYGRRALELYQAQGDIIGATEVGERLEEIARDVRLTTEQREMATKAAASLEQRCYLVRYRHPATVFFQRAFLVLLAFVIFLIPASIIRLETGSAVVPEITFKTAPLLRADDPNFTPNLSQGVVALNLSPSPNPRVLLWLGLLLLLAYLVLSTGFGLLVIAITPLQRVQAATQTQAIRLDRQSLRVGEDDAQQVIHWADVTNLVKADVRFVNDLMIDNSASALFTPQHRIEITGNTAWYSALGKHIGRLLPATVQRSDFSYSILRSWTGLLYLLTIGIFILLSILGTVAASLVTRDIPGTPYSLADLYPYLYLGLFIPPMWWFVAQPLRIRRHIKPLSALPWWIGGAGLALGVLRVLTRFYPWLTVPDIYPSLAILLMVGGASLTIWRTYRSRTAKPAYPLWIRSLAVVVAAIVFFVMGSHLWREVRAYHYLVIGNTLRDRALSLAEGGADKEALVNQAVAAYGRAIEIAETPVLGFDGQAALQTPLGIPQPRQTIWFAAHNSRAAMQGQLGHYQEAIAAYTQLLLYTTGADKAQIYASRAIVYQGLGTTPNEATDAVEVDRPEYSAAISDFEKAIELAPEEATYYLWRGVAYHALGNLDRALSDYETALAVEGGNALDASSRVEALVGEGSIFYERGEYERAAELFRQAADEDEASPEAHLRLGYAYYSLRQYDAALTTWQEAAALSPADPLIFTSLGTLYWRQGNLGDDPDAPGTERCADNSLPQEARQASAALLEQSLEQFNHSIAVPGQAGEEVAFTYRTKAQVHFLLKNCPGYDKVEALQEAIDNYGQAIQLDQDNPLYWHFRGRLSYVLWQNLPAGGGPPAREWLFRGLADTEKALELDRVDKGDYRPNAWRVTLLREAVEGSLNLGDTHFADGEYDAALSYYELVANNRPENAEAAFKAGLAALALNERGQAQLWYEAGLARAAVAGDEAVVQAAQQDLTTFVRTRQGLDAAPIYDLFEDRGIDLSQAQDAATIFDLALAATMEDNLARAAELYHRGLELAAEAANRNEALTAADELRAYLLANPDVAETAVYWPLYEDPALRETAAALLENPDLFWRYRADFGFRLITDLFKMRPGKEKTYEVIFTSIILDIERAFALNPDRHRIWRDFFVDANTGWLYLRRGDEYYVIGEYELALVDYEEATRRIRPDSEDAINDVTDATFKAGLTALRLQLFAEALAWYRAGIDLVERYEGNDAALNSAEAALEALLDENPNLALVGEAILEDLDEAH